MHRVILIFLSLILISIFHLHQVDIYAFWCFHHMLRLNDQIWQTVILEYNCYLVWFMGPECKTEIQWSNKSFQRTVLEWFLYIIFLIISRPPIICSSFFFLHFFLHVCGTAWWHYFPQWKKISLWYCYIWNIRRRCVFLATNIHAYDSRKFKEETEAVRGATFLSLWSQCWHSISHLLLFLFFSGKNGAIHVISKMFLL